jgi:hypothetical protein
MQRYIEQLIEDLQAATWKTRPPHAIWDGIDPDNENDSDDISYVEEFIYGQEERISSITGIERKLLPPVDGLSDDQAGILATELEKLLNVFNFYPDFPGDYPAHLRYPLLLGLWNKKYVPLSFGESHIGFCSFDEKECPFPGYCSTCKEIKRQMEIDEHP